MIGSVPALPRRSGHGTRLGSMGGSMVVCLATPDAVYVSADSRYCSPDGEVFDFGKKLIPHGATGLCGLAGQLRFARVVADRRTGEVLSESAFDLADIVARLPPGNGLGESQAKEVGQTLYEALLPIWMSYGHELDHPFGRQESDGGADAKRPLAQILHVDRSQSGQIYIDRIDLRHSLRVLGVNRYESVLALPRVQRQYHGRAAGPMFFVLGSTACMRPDSMHIEVRDHGHAADILDGIFARAVQAPACAATVGGAIDIAVISESGREWLRQKPWKAGGAS